MKFGKARQAIFSTALLGAVGLAGAAQAGGTLGSPPPSPTLEGAMRLVLSLAQPSIGREISPGMVLTAATSRGDTAVFMTRAKDIASVEIGMIQDPRLSLQQRFVKTFGRKFCRKGSGSRAFIERGGRISIAALSQSGKLLVGGTLTRC